MVSFLPSDVLNAVRLGRFALKACYTASFGAGQTAQGGPFTMMLRISDARSTPYGPLAGILGTITVNKSFASSCGGQDAGDYDRQGLWAVKDNCNPTAQWLADSTDTTVGTTWAAGR